MDSEASLGVTRETHRDLAASGSPAQRLVPNVRSSLGMERRIFQDDCLPCILHPEAKAFRDERVELFFRAL